MKTKSHHLTLTNFAKQMSLLVLATMFCVVTAAAGDKVYVVNLQQGFGTVDLETGAYQPIGPGTPAAQANLIWGPDGVLYSLSVFGDLVTIDPKTGDSKVIGATGLGYNAFALAGAHGKLYATDFSNNIYSVDAQSGLATLIGSTGIPADPSIPFTTNSDGTLNLCDETFYGVNGKLYATFDSFTIDPNTLAMTAVVSANLYEIDPKTGVATLIAPTAMNLGATVANDGRFYAFHLTPLGFNQFGPVVKSQVVRLDLRTGKTKAVVNVDPNASGIVGAVPVRDDD